MAEPQMCTQPVCRFSSPRAGPHAPWTGTLKRAARRRRVDVAVDPLKHAAEQVAVRPVTGKDTYPHAMWKRASRSSTGRLPLEDGLRPERAWHSTPCQQDCG